MACEVDLRGAVFDGKRGDFTGKAKPTGDRRGFLSVSDSAPRGKPRDEAEGDKQADVEMDGDGKEGVADADEVGNGVFSLDRPAVPLAHTRTERLRIYSYGVDCPLHRWHGRAQMPASFGFFFSSSHCASHQW